MRFDVFGMERELCFWKREYKNLAECEDYAGGIPDLGLFAISDGAGTTNFSGIWAQCLVEQFLAEPLLSTDGFEVERWLLRARTTFQQRVPDPETLPPDLRNDLLYRGAAATFAGVQFRNAVDEPGRSPVAACFALVIGDSCAIHYGGDGRIIGSHAKQSAEDFDASPICFPTKGYDAAWWRAAEEREFSIREGDYVVLATDAVSRWLLVDDESLRRERFELLVGQNRESWPHLVESLRRRRLMRDDDSTAVVIHVFNIIQPVSASAMLDARIRDERRSQLENALKSKDLLVIALEYGSGAYFENLVVKDGAKSTPLATHRLLIKSQRMVEARRTLLEALGRYMERGKRNRDELKKIWYEFSAVLISAPFADGARRTLEAEGFDLSVPCGSPKEQSPRAMEGDEESGRDAERAASASWPPRSKQGQCESDAAGTPTPNSEQEMTKSDEGTATTSRDARESTPEASQSNDNVSPIADDGTAAINKDAGAQ